ncbi:tricorn protease domain 2-containing protein [Saitoella complicata NRRL Y-17804]|uniref:tricorn protease domain 2-containing protein n=1 Tax=Saitoella complicata (strain BCRC 22490 / CBS 7301 / JCM 7358 / NBRC 10748 / NRRL Y-17804) TaxID=698492 RepID=UPI000867EAAB|nr:tricorn protease domain 2-containing protein [Saitoella complicata NRRL Y-17804]ODQ54063.1 tricorn protease domain 2-containing protein [Saitoella complicata NRRL Y-17804]
MASVISMDNQQDCTFTLLALFPSLAEQVSHELDVEGITADLQQKKAPSKAAEGDETGSMISGMSEVAGDGNGRSKAELWNDLKILSITRTLTLIYCLVLLTVLTRVQLNIIGRGTYVSSVVTLLSPVLNNEVRIEEEDGDERTDLERDYLSFSWWLIHNGWKGLSAKVKTAVDEVIGVMSLKEELSLAQFDLIICRIRAIVEKESFLQFLLPLTPADEAQVLRQFTDRDGSRDADGAEGTIVPSLPLHHLIDETHDFLSSPDAVIVINQLLDAGVHTLIENMAAAIYPPEPSVDNTDILQRRVRLARRQSALSKGRSMLGRWRPEVMGWLGSPQSCTAATTKRDLLLTGFMVIRRRIEEGKMIYLDYNSRRVADVRPPWLVSAMAAIPCDGDQCSIHHTKTQIAIDHVVDESINMGGVPLHHPSTARAPLRRPKGRANCLCGMYSSTSSLHINANRRSAVQSNKSIFLRSLTNPAESIQYDQHTHPTTVAKFSPSGYYVASADASGAVRVWDCAGTDQILKLETKPIAGALKDLAWDSESKRLIAVGDGKERFGAAFTADSGNSVGEISGHSSVVNAVSIRQQRPFRAVTASDDTCVVFYTGVPFRYSKTIRTHGRFVYDVAFSPDGEYFVSVGADAKVFLYSGKEGEVIGEFDTSEGHKGSIFAVSWSPDSKFVVTASADATLKAWDISSQTCVETWSLSESDGPSVPDQQVGVVWTAKNEIVSLSLCGDLNVFTRGNPKPAKIIKGHQKGITALTATEDAVWTGSYDGVIRSWDTKEGEAREVEGETHTNQVVEFAQVDGGKVWSVGWDDTIRIADARVRSFDGSVIKTDSQPRGVSRRGGEVFVAVVGGVVVYDAKGEKVGEVVTGYEPTAISANPMSEEVAVGGADNVVRVYTFKAGKFEEKTTLTGNRAPVTVVAFSPSGTLLATADSSGKIILYSNTPSSTYEIKTTRWQFHNARITSLAWNTDSTKCASGSLDTGVCVFDTEKVGKWVGGRGAHKDGCAGVVWSGVEVVSVGADATVKRWRVEGS